MLKKGDMVTLRYLPRGESRNFKSGDRLQLHGFDGRRGKFLATRPVGSAHFSLNNGLNRWRSPAMQNRFSMPDMTAMSGVGFRNPIAY